MLGIDYLWITVSQTNNTTYMKRILAFSLLLGCSLALSAQQALGPGTGLVSPEINPDHSVTFRYHNPKAITVQVTGDFLCYRYRV